ncbi:hypothetical protein Q9R29_01125 [Rothia sp. ARF10]|nr:hypothetical protein [Rothia sp. ARF10]
MDDDTTPLLQVIHLADQRLAALREERPGPSDGEGWYEIPSRCISLLGPLAKTFQRSTVWVKAFELNPDDAAILEKSTKFVDGEGWTRPFGHIDGDFSVNVRFRETSIPVQMPPIDPVTAAMAIQLAVISHQLGRIEAKLDAVLEVVSVIRRDQINEDFAKTTAMTRAINTVHEELLIHGGITQTDWDELPRHRDLEERHVKILRTLNDQTSALSVRSVKDAKSFLETTGPDVLEQLAMEWELLRGMAQLAELRAAVRISRGEAPRQSETAPVLRAFTEASEVLREVNAARIEINSWAQQAHQLQEKQILGGLSIKSIARPFSGIANTVKSKPGAGAAAGAATAAAATAGVRTAASGVAPAALAAGAAPAAAAAAAVAAPLVGGYAASKGLEMTAHKHDRIREDSTALLQQIHEASAAWRMLLPDVPERAVLDTDHGD